MGHPLYVYIYIFRFNTLSILERKRKSEGSLVSHDRCNNDDNFSKSYKFSVEKINWLFLREKDRQRAAIRVSVENKNFPRNNLFGICYFQTRL